MSHIYFLDVTVFKLCVDQRIVRDAEDDTDFAVIIDLMDVPSLIIRRTKLIKHNEKQNNRCFTNLDYNAGRACHFAAKKSSLVNSLKRKPLKIGVYRVDERFPVCHGVVPFTGCICDMISQLIEEPSPFEFGGTFNLIDPGNNPAGSVTLRLVLTDLGRHVTTSYALDRDAFVLKNDLNEAEYKCARLKKSGVFDKENYPVTMDKCCSTELTSENLMRDIAGISLGACNLSLGKKQPRVYEPLEVLDKLSEETKANASKSGNKKFKKKSNKKTKGR